MAERAAKKRREKCGRRSSVAMADDACDEWPFHAGSRGPATGALRPADGALDVDNMEHFWPALNHTHVHVHPHLHPQLHPHNYTYTPPVHPQQPTHVHPRPQWPTTAKRKSCAKCSKKPPCKTHACWLKCVPPFLRPSYTPLPPPSLTHPLTPPETQRALFRALHPQARHRAVQQRRGLFQSLHGEVHGRVEHGQQAVCGADPARAGCGRAGVVTR